MYDAAIIGAGPAGTSAAIHLALRGRRVLLAEAKSFPRAKLCGEFITPECFTHFRQLGVETAMMNAGGTHVTETNFFAASGAQVSVPSVWFGSEGTQSFALGLSRAEMDTRLLARAREVGVEVREETQAVNLLYENRFVRGVILRGKDKREAAAHARVTVDATGRGRVLVRRLEAINATQESTMPDAETTRNPHRNPSSSRSRAGLVAFKTHLVVGHDGRENDDEQYGEQCEIYFYKGGYGGLNGVEGGVRNLCFIVRAEDVKARDGNAARVMREVVCGNRRARQVLDKAEVVAPWLCVALESFGRNKIAPAPGLLAVGDAAAFIDPFTGSGMLMALDGGATLARTLSLWLEREDARNDANIESWRRLAFDYEASYEAKFAGRLRVCAWLRRAAFAPAPVIEVATRMLGVSASARRITARATRKE